MDYLKVHAFFVLFIVVMSSAILFLIAFIVKGSDDWIISNGIRFSLRTEIDFILFFGL